MMVILFALSMIGCALAEVPYPQPRKPQGALLLLPPEFSKKSEYNNQPSETEDLEKISEKVMDRLRQEQGSGSGSYHVYLNDGRLQKVQYTTAPLKSGQQNAPSSSTSSRRAR
ncbi:uncharacterized protein [Halyomorpha halys]|uniref:uncharacterized protein n=1 Tax=Halyomorpha halys TaxID=286706 RepID=UPI000D0C87FD|nr:uncharacterized protein LOC112211342 [Halyomorpha halys]